MESSNKTFLLSNSVFIRESGEEPFFYDRDLDINLSNIDGKKVPAVTCNNHLTTQSKTFAAPGDDDADSEAENCY